MAKGYCREEEWVDYFLRELRRMIDCSECASGYAALLAKHHPDDKVKSNEDYGKCAYRGLILNLIQFFEAYRSRIQTKMHSEVWTWLPQTVLSLVAMTIAVISLF